MFCITVTNLEKKKTHNQLDINYFRLIKFKIFQSLFCQIDDDDDDVNKCLFLLPLPYLLTNVNFHLNGQFIGGDKLQKKDEKNAQSWNLRKQMCAQLVFTNRINRQIVLLWTRFWLAHAPFKQIQEAYVSILKHTTTTKKRSSFYEKLKTLSRFFSQSHFHWVRVDDLIFFCLLSFALFKILTREKKTILINTETNICK